jgi:hypothetical protein
MAIIAIRLCLIAILLVIFEIVVINLAGILPFIAVHKAHIQDAPYMDFLFGNTIHPINHSIMMVREKNPLFIIGSIGTILLTFYIGFNKGKKGEYELADKYGVYDKSRFARKKEIFVEGQTIGIPYKQLLQDLEASMDESKEGK